MCRSKKALASWEQLRRERQLLCTADNEGARKAGRRAPEMMTVAFPGTVYNRPSGLSEGRRADGWLRPFAALRSAAPNEEDAVADSTNTPVDEIPGNSRAGKTLVIITWA
jgi:hypothetical protein